MTPATTVQIEQWLMQLGEGQVGRDRLLALTCERLRQLASRMFRRGHALHRWEQTDDVLQEAMLRMSRALLDVQPQSAAQFFGLASLQIRRVLIDMSRHHFGPMGQGQRHASVSGDLGESPQADPNPALELWGQFHEAVQSLGEESRAVVDLLVYQGLSQPEAASVLGVSDRTVKRWWRTAREELHAALNGQWPEG
ncbi:RNA polymerase sigma factor [Tuwongella immobilis]|uniref:RNA polymerase sigma-70 ECF-like HTH domain-containing protein n=1 Tax=Tuwongella immobilis TaxID=692036 RepID=A0A6C2YTP2_9BACT|nr:sigma-70 family RNA polymerase sigma factor [Tuwongella immobilis]VIP04285.1 sigma-70 family rna polymerase sigma factor : RNA polymerase, sigma-24 subunit, ECF subfamily OS=Planctomyces brasiliensis (strain ATCC 49424 / DSM 5305 / JCM 21570 / NBRC 103401 / IFAM 1448) GN=Plabr_1172 PE=4 SV=1: Sigma70_ECF [Tuwongella immobilis]VTS05933.1 sigma-70 family rna polymerase sigma factor : RNA polymerase, sigma-24 subunit, ECF subfamily OS=Planctomyces brasiliensis (strain ATCC 49424 / DSM 5305 / JCM 